MGKLITIEGTDASGKATQTALLIDALNHLGKPAIALTFPDYESPSGRVISRYLGKQPYKCNFGQPNDVPPRIASTWYALNRRERLGFITKNLNNRTIVCDRYVDSNMAHQGGKIADPKERDVFFQWLEDLEYVDFGLPRPDKTIFLHIPVDVSLTLMQNRATVDGHESDKQHLLNTEAVYKQLVHRNNWAVVECSVNGAMRPIIDIHKDVLDVVLSI